MDISILWITAALGLIALSGVDLLLTVSILTQGGREFNPFIKWMYNRHGAKGIIIVKSVIIPVILLMNIIVESGNPITLWYLNFIFLVVLTLMYVDIVATPGFVVLRSKALRSQILHGRP